MAQPDEALRALNSEEPTNGERTEVFCTKVWTTHPDEMYIIGAHMDGHGFGKAANDDGSGTAIVMELARIFNAPDVQTTRSIRFALWNNEETGLNGSGAYVEQRRERQGLESPPGSGRYPEPRWLGMIQHDMMLFDHGAPGPDGVVSRDQRREADVNIEFQSSSDLADESRDLAFVFKAASDAYATDYPAMVGPHMTNTDSTPFMNVVPSISLLENERGMHVGAGWDPHWHQPTDLYSTFTDDDFRLGLNAAQTTLEPSRSSCGRPSRDDSQLTRMAQCGAGLQACEARLKPCPTDVFTRERIGLNWTNHHHASDRDCWRAQPSASTPQNGKLFLCGPLDPRRRSPRCRTRPLCSHSQ